ncbi:orotidine-5'-phosphate decarboxylase [Parasutterella muris]|jgi:orotidine 5''-phosphate decarboxylase, subfamily 2|uniref:Orotidine 5'-phosphate decarboxylase n=2 Tax=Parasutterella TaxID=577310 RepID=A0A6L6YHB9_9BURK|nr:orotidine-5'-phosphate decarboxylase [Parasutterella muris]MVX56159.1 orotidine-5'-phosphate decarboxylase [Parasutterella muris]
MKFTEMLQQRWDKNNTLLCVGLDPDLKRFPDKFASCRHPYLDFCWEIVQATADTVCAFKPQIAYFASVGAEDQLTELIRRIHSEFPGIPVILDAKRGDIGSTAKHYAKEAFERFGADCVTLSPYMGRDSVEPYLEYEDKGAFILCRTSNKGGDDLQMLDCGGKPLYHVVAEKVAEWNTTGQLGLVIGATYPNELKSVRAITPELNFLVPGIGAQGGDVNASVKSGMNAEKTGMIINSSRAILYASQGDDFAQKARFAALRTRDEINKARG